jgi:adenylate cyclase class 2
MPIEIEKKYRLTPAQRERLVQALRASGAADEGEEFEENTTYAGSGLALSNQVLRLRRVGGRGVLTYKQRHSSDGPIKRQREEETRIEDPDAMAAILEALGFKPALVYEKRRATWRLKGTEVVVDELPFGLFAEIEGDESAITEVERELGLVDVEAELATYPRLTRQHGEMRGSVVESRFQTDER